MIEKIQMCKSLAENYNIPHPCFLEGVDPIFKSLSHISFRKLEKHELCDFQHFEISKDVLLEMVRNFMHFE